MPMLPLVLDTNALRSQSFRYWLRTYHARKILPTIAYTELSYYFIKLKHKTQLDVDHMLHSIGIQVEWFRSNESQKAVELGIRFGDFKENKIDYMIAAFAYTPPWVVVTYNTDDFAFLEDRVKTPDEIMALRR